MSTGFLRNTGSAQGQNVVGKQVRDLKILPAAGAYTLGALIVDRISFLTLGTRFFGLWCIYLSLSLL